MRRIKRDEYEAEVLSLTEQAQQLHTPIQKAGLRSTKQQPTTNEEEVPPAVLMTSLVWTFLQRQRKTTQHVLHKGSEWKEKVYKSL